MHYYALLRNRTSVGFWKTSRGQAGWNSRRYIRYYRMEQCDQPEGPFRHPESSSGPSPGIMDHPSRVWGVPGMRVLEARWVRIWRWQTETNTEAVWIWVYSAALKQGILYIKKPNITSLRNYIQWNNHRYQQKSFGTVKHKNHPSITTLKLCIQWITNRTGNIIINHQNVTILKGWIQWGLLSKASGIFPGAG